MPLENVRNPPSSSAESPMATLPLSANDVTKRKTSNKPRSRIELVRLFLPQVPRLLVKTLSHALHLTPQSEFWDVLTAAIVETMRTYMLAGLRPPMTVEELQIESCMAMRVVKDIWVSEVGYSAPQGFDGEVAVREAIVAMGGPENAILPVGVDPLTAEWVGHKNKKRKEPGRSARESYDCLVSECGDKENAVLYFHGGAYWQCDPVSHREIITELCKRSSGRVFVVRYRLAPQNPFPAALIDALVSYLHLLYPPPDAFHEAVSPAKVVVAGDSAGGGLALCLLQLLLHFSRTCRKLHWNGRDVEVPLPGGVAGISAWTDLSRCFSNLADFPQGSEDKCASMFDYLTSPEMTARTVHVPSAGWNPTIRSTRKQTQYYAPDPLITNPLVSPLFAESWEGAPPIWLSVGDECLRDSSLYLVHRLRATPGLHVRFENYSGMMHVFQAFLAHLKAADRAWKSVSAFIRHCTGGDDLTEKYWQNVRIHSKRLTEQPILDEELQVGGLEFETVKGMADRAVVRMAEICPIIARSY